MPRLPPTPTWNHPLFGADPLTLTRALLSNGGLPARVWPLAGALLLASTLRTPFSLCEGLRMAASRRGSPAPGAPVFIVGHWRSGTTHLFNLMSRDPRFAWPDPVAAGLPWDHRVLGGLLRPGLERLLPRDRYVDAVAVRPDSPQEDEIALASMQNLSVYHGVYFPRRFADHYRKALFPDPAGPQVDGWRKRFEYFNRKLLAGRSDRVLLIKNPVYTGRVALIRRIYPDARFIHIHRNPYVVVESTRRFYRALLSRFALQGYDETVADDLILETYPRMIDRLYKDVRDLGDDRFLELRFDDLEREPLAQMERIYAVLGLTDFANVRDAMQRYLDTVTNHQKSTYVSDEQLIRKVDERCGRLAGVWGYAHP